MNFWILLHGNFPDGVTKGEIFSIRSTTILWKVFAFPLRGDLKKNRAFTKEFFGVRAYTLLSQPRFVAVATQPEKGGKPFANHGQNGVYCGQ